MIADSSADRPVHVVVTCANRKTQAVPAQLRLQNVPGKGAQQRFAAWTRRLSTPTVTPVPAVDLYAGEHWQIARQLPGSVTAPAALWVCSAGYGLIPAGTAIQPYAATFSVGEPDAVGATPAAARRWWHHLTRWPGPDTDQPRSFAALARRDPGAVIIAVLSEAYLRPCADDLRDAAGYLTDEEQLAVIAPPGRSPDIDDLIVPVTARLRPLVGGSLQALNVRAAAHLLRAAADGLSRTRLRKLARHATDTAPVDPSRRPTGRKLTDDEVRDHVRRSLSAGPATATSLLRQLRQTGQSCEQSRFRRLFDQVAAEVTR
ncbi:hypothetical protein [Micromonospora aurantiaca (nom. illeg.)]|uniref:hypothetical protein n=1 Tax=Micromonospora aurantiaca (nom. illeg.) TaxID=47850 RepID=UPI00378B4BF7